MLYNVENSVLIAKYSDCSTCQIKMNANTKYSNKKLIQRNVDNSNYVRSFLASNAMADAVAEDAVRPDDVGVTVAAADVNCCDGLKSCSFNCSLKFFGLGGEWLGERRRSRLLCRLCRRVCLSLRWWHRRSWWWR